MAGADAPRYHRVQLVLGAIGLAVGTLYLLGVLSTGIAACVARTLDTWPWWAQLAIVAGTLGTAHRMLVAPLSWIRGWWLPRRYGLLHQPLSAWLGDQAKALALTTLLGLAALELVYALLRTTSQWWWLIAGAAFLVVYVVMAVVLPVWIVPLFYRLTPLTDESLRERLLALAARVECPVVGVWVADQSRKSRTANAAVVGLGRTRRILLFDTILDFAPREIEAVLAHELGHLVHRDMWRGIAVQALFTLAGFAIASRALDFGVARWQLRDVADPAGLPWLALVLSVVGLLTLPLANAWSRHVERRADDFALRVTRDPDAFIGAMERLAGLNLAERRPHPWKERLLYSHPAIDRRIARARAHDDAPASASLVARSLSRRCGRRRPAVPPRSLRATRRRR
jgi:Zn-dependent protease with chaperone function